MEIQTKIPLMKVHMPHSVLKPLKKVLFSGYVSEGEVSHKFETKFQELIKNRNTSLVNSGTSALILALRAANIYFGDEVITTPMTCLATNEPILLAGAKIIWADIDPTTGNIDPKSVESKITPRTKAIIVVDWAGNPVDHDHIQKIARNFNLKVIEDASHAMLARYNNTLIGNHSDFVCFSFQAVKHLTTIDGGAIACRNESDYERVKLLRWYGCARSHTRNPIKWNGDVYEAGYKMHMNDVNAVIGLQQLKYIRNIINKHRKNACYLLKNLADIKDIVLPVETSNSESSWWLFTLKLPNSEYRDKFSRYLSEKGIGNGIAHQRNDKYALFSLYLDDDLPGVDDFCSRMLNIPCGWWLSRSDLKLMVKTIKDAIKYINQ